jgi:hypothetical protein
MWIFLRFFCFSILTLNFSFQLQKRIVDIYIGMTSLNRYYIYLVYSFFNYRIIVVPGYSVTFTNVLARYHG